MTNIHKVMVIKSDSEREEDESPSKNECHLCGKVFKTNIWLTRHAEMHRLYYIESNICNKSMHKKHMKSHVEVHSS